MISLDRCSCSLPTSVVPFCPFLTSHSLFTLLSLLPTLAHELPFLAPLPASFTGTPFLHTPASHARDLGLPKILHLKCKWALAGTRSSCKPRPPSRSLGQAAAGAGKRTRGWPGHRAAFAQQASRQPGNTHRERHTATYACTHTPIRTHTHTRR